MRREGKFTKCDQGLTSREVPSAPSGVCPSWKNQKGSSASPPSSLRECKTHLAKGWPETTLPFGTTALSRRSGDCSEAQQESQKAGDVRCPSRARHGARPIPMGDLVQPT